MCFIFPFCPMVVYKSARNSSAVSKIVSNAGKGITKSTLYSVLLQLPTQYFMYLVFLTNSVYLFETRNYQSAMNKKSIDHAFIIQSFNPSMKLLKFKRKIGLRDETKYRMGAGDGANQNHKRQG